MNTRQVVDDYNLARRQLDQSFSTLVVTADSGTDAQLEAAKAAYKVARRNHKAALDAFEAMMGD